MNVAAIVVCLWLTSAANISAGIWLKYEWKWLLFYVLG